MDISFQFSSFAEFLAMAGHGPYVWVCYLVTFIAIAYLFAGPIVAQKRLLKTLARQQKLQPGQAVESNVSAPQ